jgi:hypothetical protein
MPLNLRNPGGTGPAPAASQPISRAFGFTVLAALLILIALRHLFGSIRVEVGAR